MAKQKTHRLAILAVALLFVISALVTLKSTARAAMAPLSPLHVNGNQIFDASNTVVRLNGVNKSGAEYACVQGWGVFSGDVSDAAAQRMADRGIKLVRIPLNEDCWLGINGVNAAYAGQNYASAIVSFVSTLNAHGIYAEPEMQWSASGTNLAQDIDKMPDLDHAPAFWTSVATTFKNTPGVLFGLQNEPHDVSWNCWKNGRSACVPDGMTTTEVVGFQELVNDVRATGASQPIIIDGLDWANDLSGWVANKPSDPANNLIAGLHVYPFNPCSTVACYTANFSPVAAQVPVLMEEFGPYNTAIDLTWGNALLAWANAQPGVVGYLAWTYNFGFGDASLLNNDDIESLTPYGTWYFAYLVSPSATPTPTQSVTPTMTPTATPTMTPTATPTSTFAPTFIVGGVYTAYASVSGNSNGATETFVLEVYNGTSRIGSTSKTQTLNGSLVLSKSVSLIGIPSGTVLRIRVYAKDASGAVLNDWPTFASYIVP